ncbi:kelch-like protein 40a [Plakobranchus ocellatus]|uniref:Kelch-like protein 40a n=1 Tax=Plakobranchus ocellatus TaxID=259542 RepID=A0AAV4CLW1_9GAST|nr:kelch-like protein 40a [Plakobranchus ocellatus]
MEGAAPCPDTRTTGLRHIALDFSAYKDSSTFSDMTVVVGTTEFKCHRVILAASSDFFKADFTQKVRGRKITLKEIDENIFSTILTYMYTGKIELTQKNLPDIWRAADMLQMTPLIKELFFLVKLLYETFCCEMLDLIADSFVVLRGSSNFNRLDAEEMKYLICSDKLNLAHEDDLIETLLQWAENDPLAGSVDETHEPGVTRAQQLADFLECTRYCLMSRRFLGERLFFHPLIRADARCVALMERIQRYHAQTYLLQEWCPPASMQRIQSKMVNSLVGVQAVFSHEHVSFDFYAMDLVNQKTINIQLFKEFKVVNRIQMVYQHDKMYIFPGDGSVAVYCAEEEKCKKLGQHDILKSHLCVIGDWLYSCCKEENGRAVVNRNSFHSLHKLSDEKLSYNQVGSLHLDERERIMHITSIENTLVIFCMCKDGVSLIFFNTFSGMSTRISTELSIPSNYFSGFVTLRKDREVFVLEENGSFWRIRHCQTAQDFKLIHELTIWDETWQSSNRLCGAALVDDELLVVFFPFEEADLQKYQEQQQSSNSIDENLAGVFNKVVMIEHPFPLFQRHCFLSPVIHAAIPKAVFKKIQRQKYTPIRHTINLSFFGHKKVYEAYTN